MNQENNSQEIEQIYADFRREVSMLLDRYMGGYNTLDQAYKICDCSGRTVLYRLIELLKTEENKE